MSRYQYVKRFEHHHGREYYPRKLKLDNLIERIVEESISLELNVSELYGLFYRMFEEDKDFWWELKMEEINHATLLKAAKDVFSDSHKFPQELISDSWQTLLDANNDLLKMIDDFSKNPPSRETAFNTALKIEVCAGELHFQEAMEQTEGSEILKILQKLNKEDKDHEKRIRAYMQAKKIKIFSAILNYKSLAE